MALAADSSLDLPDSSRAFRVRARFVPSRAGFVTFSAPTGWVIVCGW